MLILIVVSIYVYASRKIIDEMHGMMVGMTFGMISGLITATLFLIPTGNFLYGVIIGSIIGLLWGIPFGKLGGHLGIMEGTIAGPMGGMMGAMLGQMIRPFDLEIFIPFFTFVFLITIAGITYAVNCRVDCCNVKYKKGKNKLFKEFILLGSLVFIVLLLASIILPFSINTDSQLSSAIYGLTDDNTKEAAIKGDYQEIDLRISALGYSPDTIIAKKDIPLRINLYADKDAGCAREIIFPDFNLDKIVPVGVKETIEINPIKTGEFNFRCSMGMVNGKLIIN